VQLPNAGNVVIEPAKLRDYLLSRFHYSGRFKAAFFETLGYAREDWRRLARDFEELAETEDAVPSRHNGYGQMYVVSGRLEGPSGRQASVTTVWIVRDDENSPRFVTAYPGVDV
jgi:hypothetical protein